jgi:predicted ATPase/DNA-binding winged helix-turn-helix (wHTH) protein
MALGQQLVYRSGACEIDLARRELRIDGVAAPVGGRAFEIIETLVQAAGELVTKDELKSHVWPGTAVGENTLQVHISAVRRALGTQRGMLKTESRRGYRLLGGWAAPLEVGANPERPSPLPLPTPPASSNLRAPASGLIGRTDALRLLSDLLSAYKVVTLTGPGGIGKTALALEAARGDLLAGFDEGGWLVELAAISDPSLVPSAVAGVLGLKLAGGVISAEAVARAIGSRNLLLVLDNCEHVIDAAAGLAETIVRLCPGAHVLATSREVLRIDGEYVCRVPPLDVPASESDTADTLLGHSAVELFIARTRALDAEFSPQEAQFSAIASICRHLDGIPLAIEFAAARAATLGIQQVVAGLEDRFALLTSGRRTALPRHRTLRAALDWSYDLLPEPERCLLRHLAVFAGGFTLEAATAVTSRDDIGEATVVTNIANLVAKSLVAFDGSATSGRWLLLETIRAYALEKLTDSGEVTAAARRHAEFFRDWLAPAEARSPLRPAIENMPRFAREIDNVRAALAWSFSASGDTAAGVVLTAAYVPVWLHLSLLAECRERAEWALGHLTPEMEVAPRQRLRLLIGLAVALILTMGSVERTRSLLAEAREIADDADADAQFRLLWAQWSIDVVSGNSRAALPVAERLSRIARRIGSQADILVGERLTGNALQYTGRQNDARECFERVLEGYVPPQHHTLLFQYDQHALGRAMLARVLCLQGLVGQAVEHAQASVAEAQATGSGLSLCWVLHYASCPIAMMTEDVAAAERAVSAMADVATTVNAPFWRIIGRSLQGKLMIMRGEFDTGVALLREALATSDETGWRICHPEFTGALAVGLAGLGRLSEALEAVNEALARANEGGELWYLPELLRIKGALLLQQADDHSIAAAEDCFLCALHVAREQGALFWELRIALSLARLRISQDRQAEARQLLAPVYDQFTEGFGIADMEAAKALLAALRPSASG